MKLLSWLLFIVYSGFVVHSAVFIPYYLPRGFFALNDKLVHGIQYFLLFCITWNALQRTQKFKLSQWALGFAFCYSLALGFLTEGLQSFVPERSPELFDLLANGAGILVASSVIAIYLRIKGK